MHILKHKSTSGRLFKVFRSQEAKKVAEKPPPLPPTTGPADIPTTRTKNQLATKEELRELRELIRYRYALDVEIWNLRDVQEYNQDIVKEKMRKADAALRKIRMIVNSLDNHSYFSTKAEHHKLQQIKFRVLEGGKRDWEAHPPWEDEEEQAKQIVYEYKNGTGAVTMVAPFELDSATSYGTVPYRAAQNRFDNMPR